MYGHPGELVVRAERLFMGPQSKAILYPVAHLTNNSRCFIFSITIKMWSTVRYMLIKMNERPITENNIISKKKWKLKENKPGWNQRNHSLMIGNFKQSFKSRFEVGWGHTDKLQMYTQVRIQNIHTGPWLPTLPSAADPGARLPAAVWDVGPDSL